MTVKKIANELFLCKIATRDGSILFGAGKSRPEAINEALSIIGWRVYG